MRKTKIIVPEMHNIRLAFLWGMMFPFGYDKSNGGDKPFCSEKNRRFHE
jgi:hypothetical protein